ncbi:MAG: glycosyltransferase family 39 protein [Acetobacteraceae bacterium]|nr:glycosyltransferase family 39 protein [Acetobacteraceae bacterium]
MLETGDFVEIRFGDVARNKKPVGIHWAQAAAVSAAEAVGVAERSDIWPYRLPSALGGLVAALATFWLGRALVGREAALIAALLLPACLVVTVEMHIAKTDAALLGTVAVMMGLFGRAVVAPERFGPGAAAGFWLALGAGALLKGPVAPMVAGLAAVAVWAGDRLARRPSPWVGALRPAWGVPLALAVVLPWAVAIWVATDGAFFLEAIRGDLGQKVVGADEQHGGPPGYHLAACGRHPVPCLARRAARHSRRLGRAGRARDTGSARLDPAHLDRCSNSCRPSSRTTSPSPSPPCSCSPRAGCSMRRPSRRRAGWRACRSGSGFSCRSGLLRSLSHFRWWREGSRGGFRPRWPPQAGSSGTGCVRPTPGGRSRRGSSVPSWSMARSCRG